MEKTFVLHKESGLSVSKDGEVFVPKSGTNPAHYTYGCDNGKGYRVVRYKGNYYYVHRLVAETYIPNPDGKKEIDHIIPVSIGGTNEVSNLRWSTHLENGNNPMTRQNLSEVMTEVMNSEETKQKIKEAMKGKHHSEETRQKIAEANKKPIIGTHKITGEIVEFESAKDAWLTLNISAAHICSCCKGKQKSAGGYEWHYKQNPLEEIYKPNIKGSIEDFFKALDDFMMEETENN